MSKFNWRQANIHFLSSSWKPRHGPHIYFCWNHSCTLEYHAPDIITSNFTGIWWEGHNHFGYINLN